MSKSRSLDERLKVLSPCSESWAEMVGNDKVRFCSHCQKSVHNLSEMTRQEALDLAFKSNGRLCVKYYVNQDQKIKFKEIKQLKTNNISPLPSNRSPLLNVAAAGLFALTLGSGISSAQTVIPTVDISYIQNQTVNTQNPELQSDSNAITGTVTDEQGAVIPGAEVTAKNIGTGAEITTQTNEEGIYYFQSTPVGKYTIRVNATGFMFLERPRTLLHNGSLTKFDCILTASLSVMGDIAVASFGQEMLNEERRQYRQHINTVELPEEVTDFFTSLFEGDIKSAKKQLKKGVNINCTDEVGETALMTASIISNEKMVKFLLNSRADISIKSGFGATALMAASVYADEKIVKKLLEAGANINDVDINGRSALLLATADNKLEIVKLLLSAGANPNLRDRENKTALSYAKEYHYEELEKLLVFIGAQE